MKNSGQKQFNNRFQGKQEIMTKDGHYGIVQNTKNPIKKGNQSDENTPIQSGKVNIPINSFSNYLPNINQPSSEYSGSP